MILFLFALNDLFFQVNNLYNLFFFFNITSEIDYCTVSLFVDTVKLFFTSVNDGSVIGRLHRPCRLGRYLETALNTASPALSLSLSGYLFSLCS